MLLPLLRVTCPPSACSALSLFLASCRAPQLDAFCLPPPPGAKPAGSVSPFLDDQLLGQVAQHLLSKLQAGGLKPDAARTYVQGLATISKAVGYRWVGAFMYVCGGRRGGGLRPEGGWVDFVGGGGGGFRMLNVRGGGGG